MWYVYVFKFCTALKRITADCCNAVGNFYACKIDVFFEQSAGYGKCAVFYFVIIRSGFFQGDKMTVVIKFVALPVVFIKIIRSVVKYGLPLYV